MSETVPRIFIAGSVWKRPSRTFGTGGSDSPGALDPLVVGIAGLVWVWAVASSCLVTGGLRASHTTRLLPSLSSSLFNALRSTSGTVVGMFATSFRASGTIVRVFVAS